MKYKELKFHYSLFYPIKKRKTHAKLGMATWWIRIGVESLCTRTRNPKLKPKTAPNTDSGDNPSQNQTRRYPKPEWIPKTRFVWQHSKSTKDFSINRCMIYIHIFTCINKRQQIINIFMSQFRINLIIWVNKLLLAYYKHMSFNSKWFISDIH
jgi:hypothetical protein